MSPRTRVLNRWDSRTGRFTGPLPPSVEDFAAIERGREEAAIMTLEQSAAGRCYVTSLAALEAMLGICGRTLRRWRAERNLPVYRVGNSWYYSPRELDEWIRSNANRTQKAGNP